MNRFLNALGRFFGRIASGIASAFRLNGFGGCLVFAVLGTIVTGLASYGLGFIFPPLFLVAVIALGVLSGILTIFCFLIGLALAPKEPLAMLAFWGLAYWIGSLTLKIFGTLTIQW